MLMTLPLLVPGLIPILLPLVIALLLVLGQQALQILLEVGVTLLQILGLLADLVALTLVHVALALLIRRSRGRETGAQAVAGHLGLGHVIVVPLGVLLELVTGDLNAVAEESRVNGTLRRIHESHAAPPATLSMPMPVARTTAALLVGWRTVATLRL